MRKTLSIFALLAMLCIPWMAQAQTSYLFNFEDATENTNWTMENSGQAGWFIGSATNNGGSSCAYVSNDNGTTNAYNNGSSNVFYIHTAVTLQAGDYTYSFDWKANGEGNSWSVYDYMRAWIVPSTTTFTAGSYSGSYNSSPSGWLSLDDNTPLYGSSSWQTISDVITISEAGTYELVFMWKNDNSSGSNPPAAIDNISLAPLTCNAVTDLAVTTDSVSATLIWADEINSGATYNLTYTPNGGNSVFVENVTSPYTITDLTSNTLYSFSVRAICSANDSSLAATASMRTTCGAMAIPSFTDWEDIPSNGAWPSCWTRIIADGTDPSVNYNYNHTDDGEYSMYLQAYSAYNMFASSAVPLPGNTIKVNFWAYLRSGSTGWIKAGVMTDLTDTSTFIPLLNITNQNDTWTEYEFTTANLDATATYYVAWLSYSTRTYGAMGAIDDITIGIDNGCNKPSVATVSNVGPYSADFSWTNGGSGATAYDLFYGTTNSFANATVVSGLTDTVYSLTGLQPQTTYYAWVRTACGSDSADAKYIGSFTTQLTCAPVTNATLVEASYVAASFSWGYDNSQGFPSSGVLITITDLSDSTIASIEEVAFGTDTVIGGLTSGHSYTATFRNLCETELGTVDSASVQTVNFSTQVCTSVTGEISGGTQTTNYVPFNGYYNYSYSQILYLNSQMPSGVSTINGVAFYKSGSGSITRNLDVYIGHTALTTLSTSQYVSSSEMTQVASGYSFEAVQGWNIITFSTPFVYNSDSNLVITIDDNTGSYTSNHAWTYTSTTGAQAVYTYGDGTNFNPASPSFGYSSGTISGALDIQFISFCEAPTCYAPMATLGDVDSNNITVNWVSTGTESNFVCQYQAESATTWTEAGTETGNTYTFTNLAPNTLYNIRIGSICGDDTLWSEMSVRTTCATMALPYTETFTGADNDAVSCWTVVRSYQYGSYDYYSGGYIYVDYPCISGNALQFKSEGDSVMIASSEVPLAGNTIKVSFEAKSNYSSYINYFKAGVMTNLNDPTTFIPMVNQVPGGEYEEFEFSTANLDANATYYVAFCYKASSSYSSYVNVDNVNIRPDDGCNRVADLTVDSATSDEIHLSWTVVGESSTDIVVSYTYPGFTGWTVENATDSTHIIYGAVPATAYTIRVGVVCSDDTLWRETTAVTACDIIPIDEENPYYQDFDAYAEDVMPPCWLYDATYHTHYDGGCFFRTNAHQATQAVVLPQFSEPVSSLLLNFSGKLTPCDGIAVGAADADGANIVWLDTLQQTGQSQAGFLDYEYNFSANYTGEGVRIAIRSTNTGSCTGVGGPWSIVDNVLVSVVPTCLRPVDLEVHNQADEDSTYFTWTDAAGNSSFQVAFDTVTVAADDLSNILTIADTSYLIPAGSLARGGKYVFYVRSICSGSETSAWRTIEFACGEVIMPASGTDTVTGCGFVVYDNGGASSGYIANSTSTVVLRPENDADRMAITAGVVRLFSGSTLYVYDGEGTDGDVLFQYSGDNSIFTFSDTLITGEDGPMTVFLSAGASIAAGFELFISCIPAPACRRPQDLTANYLDANSAVATWTGTAASYGVHYRPINDTVWTDTVVYDDSITIYNLQPETTYELYVQGLCGTDSSTVTNTVTFTTPASCFFNSPLAVSVTGTNTAVASWDGNASTYHLYYREEGETAWTLVVVTDTNAYEFTSLTSGTRYEAMLRGICATDDSTTTAPTATFTTSCEAYQLTPATPLVEDFESAEAPASCFSVIYGDNNPSVNTVTHSTDGAYSGTRGFRFSSYSNSSDYNQTLVSPLLSANGSVAVQFYYKRSNTDAEYLTVGYSTSGNDSSDFAWSTTFVAGEDWALYTDTFPAATKFVAVRYWADYKYYTYIDSLVLSIAGDACMAPVDVAATADAESVTVTYSAVSTCQVAITNGTWDSEALGIDVAAGLNTYTFTGLTSGTPYNVGVRQMCGENVYSEWVVVNVTTLDLNCVAPTLSSEPTVTFNTVTLSWTANGEESAWEVEVYSTTSEFSSTVTTTSATITNLLPGIHYNAHVRALCGANSNVPGPWSDEVDFTTDICQPVTDVTVSNITGTTAQVSWTNGSNGNGTWQINYGTTGFPTGQGEFVNTNDNPYTITGLEGETSYDVYVAAICAEGVMSTWSAANFTTGEGQGINDVSAAQFTMYPNPATSTVTVEAEGAEQIEIVDMNGRVVYSAKINNSQSTVDVSTLAQGAYFVKVTGSSINAVRKLIVK